MVAGIQFTNIGSDFILSPSITADPPTLSKVQNVAIIVIVKLSVAIYLKPQQAQCWCQTISAGLTPPSSPRHNMQLQLHTHKHILSLEITNFQVCLV